MGARETPNIDFVKINLPRLTDETFDYDSMFVDLEQKDLDSREKEIEAECTDEWKKTLRQIFIHKTLSPLEITWPPSNLLTLKVSIYN